MVQIDPKGAYNRAPILTSKNMHIGRITCMCALCLWIYNYGLSQKKNLLFLVKKPPKKWNDNDIKKESYDLKAINILISILSVDMYF